MRKIMLNAVVCFFLVGCAAHTKHQIVNRQEFSDLKAQNEQLSSQVTDLQKKVEELEARPPVQCEPKLDDMSVKGRILRKAAQMGFKRTDVLLHIAYKESRYNPMARGRAGEIGLYQFKYWYHGFEDANGKEQRDMTKADAQNVERSTQAAIEHLRRGECGIWTTHPSGCVGVHLQ